MMSLWTNTRVVSQVLSWVDKRVKSAFAPQRLIMIKSVLYATNVSRQ